MEKLDYLVSLKTFQFFIITIKATGAHVDWSPLNWVSHQCVPATTVTGTARQVPVKDRS